MSFEELQADTRLDPRRLRGYATNLKEDGYLIFEREEILRLTHSGGAALEKLGEGRDG